MSSGLPQKSWLINTVYLKTSNNAGSQINARVLTQYRVVRLSAIHYIVTSFLPEHFIGYSLVLIQTISYFFS